MPEVYDLVFCCDDAYSSHLAVTIFSIFVNTEQRSNLRCWILSNGISGDALDQLTRVAALVQAQLCFVRAEDSMIREARVTGHVSLAAYYRVLIPSLLPSTLKRALYLDCDLIVERDICALLSNELNGAAVGAVRNPGFSRWDELGVERSSGYFNSGVLVIDLEAWRSQQICEKTIAYIKSNGEKLHAWDQDALNVVLQGNWHCLDPRWNQQRSFLELSAKAAGLTEVEWDKVRREPWVIHYSSSSKPWQFADDHPLKIRYHHYRKLAGLPPLSYGLIPPRELARWLFLRLVPRAVRKIIRKPMRLL